jgi:uncharacterized membrane protein YfcA
VIYLSRGQIDGQLAAAVVSGVFIGATVGARMSRRVPRDVLSLIFVALAAILSAQMVLRALGA